MRKRFFRIALQSFVVMTLGFFCWTLYSALFYSPETEIIPPPVIVERAPINTAATSSLPSRLIIPALHIDAYVQKAGLKADGSMGTPNNFTDVAWYKYGTVPGQEGSAVIDGHVDNGLALAGVFKHLSDIKVGDDVYVQDQNGKKLHFVVNDIQIYPYKNVPTTLVFAQNDAARLNLVTCDGSWVQSGKTYNERLVVFTKLVTQEADAPTASTGS